MSKVYAWLMLIFTTIFFFDFVLRLPYWGVPPGTGGVQGIFGPLYSWFNWIVVFCWYLYWTMAGE